MAPDHGSVSPQAWPFALPSQAGCQTGCQGGWSWRSPRSRLNLAQDLAGAPGEDLHHGHEVRLLDDEGRREGDHVDVRPHEEPVPKGRLADPPADGEPVVEAAPRGRVADELDADEEAGTPDVPDDPERPEMLGEELPEPDAHLLCVLGQPPVEDLADRGDPRRRRHR